MTKLISYIIVLTITVFLIGCGYSGLYYQNSDSAPYSSVRNELEKVRIETIEERSGQVLRNHLTQIILQEDKPLYSLQIELKEDVQSFGTTIEGTATRERVLLTADCTLIDLRTQHLLDRFTSSTAANYNIVTEQFAVITARETAKNKALKTLSQLITTRLSLYFKKNQQSDHMHENPTP